VIKEAIRYIAGMLGYEIKKKPEHPFDLENEADEAIRKVRHYTMLPRERLLYLYNQVVFCEKNNIPGSFVECGVWKGGAVALMALANMRFGGEPRHIHLFDSFQEICEPDAFVDGARAIREVKKWTNDGGTDGKLIQVKGIYDALGGPGTLEGNRELLEKSIGYPPEFLHYHKGWFQDTLSTDADLIGSIAILRLDSDWYASTKVCLEYLYDLVVLGGFVIVDDYGAYDGCRRAIDEFIGSRGISAYLSHADAECRYWIKP
jgi:hypothetical protein